MSGSIWQQRGFLAYLVVAFLNAFTDLGHKIIIQNALFKFYDGTELRVYTAIIQAMILLPFVLTFTPAGWLSDRFPKHLVIRYCALAAVPITGLITLCYGLGAFWPAFVLTFVLALQSALYSPAKFGYIRELLGKEKLAPGNAAVNAISLGAILAGTLAYTLLFEGLLDPNYASLGDILQSVQVVGFLLVAGTTLEFLLSLRLPLRAPQQRPEKLRWQPYVRMRYLRDNLAKATRHEAIWLSIIGLSIFFAINQVVLANFGAHLKEAIGETDTRVANGLMALGGIGVIVGSIMAGRVSRNYIETGLIPFAAMGMAASLFLLPLLESRLTLALLFTAFGIFGGLLVVPFNSLIQYYARDGEIGTVLAGRNFVENIFMLLFLFASAALAFVAIRNASIFIGLGFVALVGFGYALWKIPQAFVRYVAGLFVARGYRVQVMGLDNLPVRGGVLLLGNHVSWLDWAMLQIACPRPIRFVMERNYYERWYLRWFLDLFGVIPITRGGSARALDSMRNALTNGEVVALFPEGHLTHSGHLSTFRTGFERAVGETGAVIVPFYLRGLWGSRFSYASRRFREASRDGAARTITVGFGTPLPESASAIEVKQAVLETAIHTWFDYVGRQVPIAASFVRTAKARGNQLAVMEAAAQLSYRQLLAAVLAFRGRLKKRFAGQQRVGLLLPSSSGAVIANLASLMLGRTVVNLNYTAPGETVAECARRAGIRTVLTSTQFLQRLDQRGFDAAPLEEVAELVPLEEIRATLSRSALLARFIQGMLLPTRLIELLYCKRVALDDTAAILFSSGSEGTPKGVELTHANIIGNLKQIASVLNPTDEDVILNALPVFHAFGLTVTTFLPLVEGIPMVCQPDPTDAKAVARLVARYRVTILLGTSTFLRLYLRSKQVHPVMFESLRVVVAGAEKLSPDVRSGFRDKFGKEIFEGYGTTETTPVACVNLPDTLVNSDSGLVQTGHKPGTVGLPLPGARIRIVDPETLQELPVGEAGLVLIGGTQIMKGYLDDPQRTAEAIVEQDGVRWYKSGDKGRLDEDGFLTIVDRYSRFAKVGGEMVSLGAVESRIVEVLGEEADIAAVAVPDTAKGEQIALLLAGGVDDDSAKTAITGALPPLMQPKHYVRVAEIPKLGSGKTDLAAAKALARDELGRE
ncbi:MAG: acyl-[ACP]--phospholipid O-acyltransferase [Pseudomonadota bacterium]|nr:acyl-[ACP]--phospholipid O-acyltransferase [Pseudomonadota bacterium]